MVMKREVIYFEKAGPSNTKECLSVAKKIISEKSIPYRSVKSVKDIIITSPSKALEPEEEEKIFHERDKVAFYPDILILIPVYCDGQFGAYIEDSSP